MGLLDSITGGLGVVGKGFDQGMNGLLGPSDPSLPQADQEAIRKQARLALGLQLLANSGPSTQPRGFGQVLANSAMGAQQVQQQGTQQALSQLLAKRNQDLQEAQLNRPVEVNGNLVNPMNGAVVYKSQLPTYKPTDPLGQLEMDYRNGLITKDNYNARVKMLTTHQPTTTVNVSTDKKFGEAMASKMAEQYAAQYDAAQSSTEAIASAQRVREVLRAVPYTGAGADYKLAFGKAAKAAGFDYGGDDISNTELLAKELGQNVLNSVKSSGLAGSQGLTEGERKFLLQVVGGTITLDNKTLSKIADLNERTARNAIKKWNATASRLDKGTLQSLGMGTIDEGSPSNNMGNGWSIEPVK